MRALKHSLMALLLVPAAFGQNPATPEAIEALSKQARGALAAREFDKAGTYAAETRKLVLEQLKRRKLDAERLLPLALGASIEVQARVLAERGERAQAVGFLTSELKAWWDTSIRTRIQKNLNLLTLEGKPAPPLEVGQWLGPQPLPLSALKGRPVLLFFWAHWCPDCKGMAPILADIEKGYGLQGANPGAGSDRGGIRPARPGSRRTNATLRHHRARPGGSGRPGVALHRPGAAEVLRRAGKHAGSGERGEPPALRRQHRAHVGAY